jgi:hypothetical protein
LVQAVGSGLGGWLSMIQSLVHDIAEIAMMLIPPLSDATVDIKLRLLHPEFPEHGFSIDSPPCQPRSGTDF